MTTRTAKVGATLFLYKVPGTNKRRWATRGDEIEVSEEDYARLERGNGLYVEKEDQPTEPEEPAELDETPTNNDPYDEMKVADAIAFLEALPEEERDPYFDRERKDGRKGVLAHFDQPTE